MPRRSKLTPERQARICELLAAGNYIETVCKMVGISEQSFYVWMRSKVDFREAVEKAQADAEARNVVIIQQAAKKNWTAAAWFLERKFNEKWGRKDKLAGLEEAAEGLQSIGQALAARLSDASQGQSETDTGSGRPAAAGAE